MEGVDLPHFPVGRPEAIRRAGEILQNNAPCVAPGDDWRIEVKNDSGLTLFVMTVAIYEAPAVLRGDRTSGPDPATAARPVVR